MDWVSDNQKLFSQVDDEICLFVKNLKMGTHQIPKNLSIHAYTIGGKFLQDFLAMKIDLKKSSEYLFNSKKVQEDVLRLKYEVKEL